MSLSYPEIVAILQEVKPLIEKQRLFSVKEVSPKSFVLLFGPEEEHQQLLLSFSVPCVRFHLSTAKGGTPKSPFIASISNMLAHSTLNEITLLNEDRILELQFSQKNRALVLIAELFSKSPNCYLVDGNRKILTSLIPSTASHYSLPNKPEIPFPLEEASEVTSKVIEQTYKKKEKELLFSKEKNRLASSLKSKIKKSEKKKGILLTKLEQANGWEQVSHKAQLLQANLYRIEKGATEVTVEDWESGTSVTIPLEEDIAPNKYVDTLFKESHKLRESISYLQERIEKIDHEIQSLSLLHNKALEADSFDALKDIASKEGAPKKKKTPLSKQREAVKKRPYREFFSKSGLRIWVGRDAKSNNQLTFHCANGNDTWLHAQQWSGSHVVIRVPKGKAPDEEAIQDACQLALYYSKARKSQETEVILTQRKYVTRGKKGNLGMVNISKHKSRHVHFDEKRLKAIRERKAELIPLPGSDNLHREPSR